MKQKELKEEPGEETIFEGIDSKMVQKAARNKFGSAGPSKVDANILKQMLCSQFKNLSSKCEQLCYQLAPLTRALSKHLVDPKSSQELLACRLIPLGKELLSEKVKIRSIKTAKV